MRAKRSVLEQDALKWLEVADLLLKSRQANRLANWVIYAAGYAIEFAESGDLSSARHGHVA